VDLIRSESTRGYLTENKEHKEVGGKKHHGIKLYKIFDSSIGPFFGKNGDVLEK
jgi:hypothetical protein